MDGCGCFLSFSWKQGHKCNAGLLLVLLPANSLISNWFTWKMSILPKSAPSPFSGDCPTRHWEFTLDRPQGTHSPSEPIQVEYAGLHTEMSGNQTQNLVTWPPRCKNWDKQENYTIWQRAKVFLSEILMSSIQQFIVLLGSVPRGVTHLTVNFHGRNVKNPPTASSDHGFPPQALWSSVPDVSPAIMVYWECLGDFLGCEIKCSALTTNMEEKPRQ